MISTVTTATVTTVTTVTLAGSVALIGIIVLFSLLIQKEVTAASGSPGLAKLGKALNIAIIPLLIAFILVVITKVSQVLN
jgi:hypothetical protein